MQQLQAKSRWDETALTTFKIQLKDKYGWTEQRWAEAERELHRQWDYGEQ